MKRYEVFRSYGPLPRNKHRPCVVLKRDLTLEEAQEHCNDPETSYSTCSQVTADRLSIEGQWSEQYREQ